jgi:hypothetical protein
LKLKQIDHNNIGIEALKSSTGYPTVKEKKSRRTENNHQETLTGAAATMSNPNKVMRMQDAEKCITTGHHRITTTKDYTSCE